MSKLEIFLYLYEKKYLKLFFYNVIFAAKENFKALCEKFCGLIVNSLNLLICILFFILFPIIYPIHFTLCKKVEKTEAYIMQKEMWDDNIG